MTVLAIVFIVSFGVVAAFYVLSRHFHRWTRWSERRVFNGNVEYQYRTCKDDSCNKQQRRTVG